MFGFDSIFKLKINPKMLINLQLLILSIASLFIISTTVIETTNDLSASWIKTDELKMQGILNKSVIGHLLTMENVGKNPGPMTMTAMEVLGHFMADAEDDNVKKTLNKYRTDLDHQTNVKAFLRTGVSACSVDDLKKTLIYFNSSETSLEDFHKESLAELIVLRINELLPDTCTTCKESYVIGKDDDTFLQCFNCNKGCCKECGETHVANVKNTAIKDVYWMCTKCVQTNIEFKKGKLGKPSK